MTPKRNLPNDSRTFSNLNTRDVERSKKFGGEGEGDLEEQSSIIDCRTSVLYLQKMRGAGLQGWCIRYSRVNLYFCIKSHLVYSPKLCATNTPAGPTELGVQEGQIIHQILASNMCTTYGNPKISRSSAGTNKFIYKTHFYAFWIKVARLCGLNFPFNRNLLSFSNNPACRFYLALCRFTFFN